MTFPVVIFEITGGGVLDTVTWDVAVELPLALVAVSVYVVEIVGETETEPDVRLD